MSLKMHSKQKKKDQKKKVKFVKIVFRIPLSRKKQLERYCKANNTTSILALRKIINNHLDEHTPAINEQIVAKNQLTLFDLKAYDQGGIQTTMDF